MGMRPYVNRACTGVVCIVWACSPAATVDRAPPTAGTSPTDPGVAEQAAAVDSVRRAYTRADVDFMAGMIHHHAQALAMSRMAPTHGASPSLQIMARRIINAQNDEIAWMQRWLRDRGQTVPEIHIEGTTLMVHGADHAMHMPGMLTPDQMRELDAAQGSAFDRLFLTYMIQHHEGAVTMVYDLFATDGAGQDEEAFKLASDIQVDQRTEIARMKLMLSEMPAAEGAP